MKLPALAVDDAADERIALLRAAQPPEQVKRVGRAYEALERIRAIVDSMPRAFAVQDIKAALADALGPHAYATRKPMP